LTNQTIWRNFTAAVSTGEAQEPQDILEALQVDDRLRKALLVLKKELINAQLQSKLSRDVDTKIAKRQRECYLMEQLKVGMESDGKDKLIENFKERAAELKMPETAKLSSLEPAASEANVTRNYLDWLTQIPWTCRKTFPPHMPNKSWMWITTDYPSSNLGVSRRGEAQRERAGQDCLLRWPAWGG
jgi:ATP-dependent Lon protease